MIVTFISQCEKKALNRTRRILDAFANRIGDNVWQTAITEDGLDTVKKLLRASATKSTAVACHRIKTRHRTQLVWVVGNKRQFDEMGKVAVNCTQKDISIYQDSKLWQNLQLVGIASALAGLFHDFGKANTLFQNKLNPNKNKGTKNHEPYRHEWVSFKLFEGFVQNRPIKEWLESLVNCSKKDESFILDYIGDIKRRNNLTTIQENTGFKYYDDFTKLVAWLILSHHRLLVYPYFLDNAPTFDNNNLNQYFLNDCDIKWNSPNYEKTDWLDIDKQANWEFPQGLPIRSQTWQKKAKEIALNAQKSLASIERFCWQDDLLTNHLARMMLMMADHFYSSQNANRYFWDKNYLAYANTDANRQYKQHLDEHNIMVAHHAYQYSQKLPKFLAELPVLDSNRTLERGFDNADPQLSEWQNKAVALSHKINEQTQNAGFFGINMASTGKGKTFANARIIYTLADKNKGCRFSVALGLRTLTTQTGQALQKNLHLDDSEIATLIGSKVILRLLNANNEANQKESQLLKEQRQLLEDLEKTALALRGSESLELDNDFEVEYDEDIQIEKESLLNQWFAHEPKYQKLLHAPILVSTIDYLVPATEGLRGGKQISPMLRLLSGDLVLDEPDEFGLADLPALARLVNWAGMLGSKVLLSSATIPPAMAVALFEAYQAGRKIYHQCMIGDNQSPPVVCAWFDEFLSTSQQIQNHKEFINGHKNFIDKRIKNLSDDKNPSRKAKIIPIQPQDTALDALAKTIYQTIFLAHDNHYQTNGRYNISMGVIRFANINPLVATAQMLIGQDNNDDYCVHYCVYHSQFTLASRSSIEEKLDNLLNRKQPHTIWEQSDIIKAIRRSPNSKNHIFVVLATSVCEVGRDHDYDWAIAEPSSMRSLVQLAGRIQRHRKQPVSTENLLILDKNYRDLKGNKIVYEKPGFESKKYYLDGDKSISNTLKPEQFEHINAIPSIQLIQPSQPPYTNLVELEQSAYWYKLVGDWQKGQLFEPNNAKIWWQQQITWTGEIQRQQSFRLSSPEMTFILAPNSQDKLIWLIRDESDYNLPKMIESRHIISYNEIKFGKNSFAWFGTDEYARYEQIAERLDIDVEKIPYIYGEVSVPYYKDFYRQYFYHPFLGVFLEL